MSLENTYNESAETAKPKRVQLKHLLLDVDFFEKPKIKALRYDHEASGLLFYLAVLSDMARSHDSEIYISCICATGGQFGFSKDKSIEFVSYLLEHGLIHRGEKPNYYANRRILSDQEAMAEKQDKWKIAKRRYRDNTKTNLRQHEDKSETALGPVNIEYMNIEQLKNEELTKSGLIKHLDFVWLDEITYEQYAVQHGKQHVDRGIEKLNGWIGQAHGDPHGEFERRKLCGQNAKFVFQNWLNGAVINERSRASPVKPKQKSIAELMGDLERSGELDKIFKDYGNKRASN